MYLSRCGTAVDAEFAGERFHHAACHLNDAALDHAGKGASHHQDGVGGWHDAGDYNKYTVNGAFTVGMLLRAWEDHQAKLESLKLNIPESSNNTPDFLDEIRWELDWLLKMQMADGSVHHKLSALNFCGNIMPEAETDTRYFSPPGSAATADFIAVMAHAARVFRAYDAAFADRCLAAAEKSAAFLKANPESNHPELKAFSTGGYQADDADDRLWAYAELWETTGSTDSLAEFEKLAAAARDLPGRHGGLIESNWDWQNLRNLALFTYVLSKRPGRDPKLVDSIQRSLAASTSNIAAAADRDPYRRPLGSHYFWGCNGAVARQAINLNCDTRVRVQLGDKTENGLAAAARNRATTLDALNYIFGHNPFGRSFVTGLGHDPPRQPHDRRSAADKASQPWPGNLVGGPWPTATDWHDDYEDYKTNEIAINWNGALIYALAGFVEPATFDQCVVRGNKAAERAANSEDTPSSATNRQ